MASFAAGFALLFVVGGFGLFYFLDIRNLARQDKMVVEVLLALLAVVLAYRAVVTVKDYLRALAERRKSGEPGKPASAALRDLLRRKETLFLAVTVPYIALFPKIGFFVTTFAYLLVSNVALGTRGKLKLLAISAGVTLFTYLLFAVLFGIRLPKGVLF